MFNGRQAKWPEAEAAHPESVAHINYIDLIDMLLIIVIFSIVH